MQYFGLMAEAQGDIFDDTLTTPSSTITWRILTMMTSQRPNRNIARDKGDATSTMQTAEDLV